MPANKRHPKVTFLDGTTCTAGPECRVHAGLKIAETAAQKKQAAQAAADRTELNRFIKETTVVNAATEKPELAAQFPPELNEGKTLADFTPGSPKSGIWKCPVAEDHVWSAVIAKRVRRGDGCPYCSGHRPSSTNNLQIGDPKVASELNVEKSGITADKLTVKSNRMCVWNCPQGHEWETTPNERSKHDCPACYPFGRTHKLARQQQTLAVVGKHLLPEYDYEYNQMTPDKVPAQSVKKIGWVCTAKKHKWLATPNSRMNKTFATGCPYCSNQAVGEDNNLLFLYPETSKLLNEKLSGVRASSILPGSGKSLVWNCATKDPSHIHKAQVRDKTGLAHGGKAIGCPYCTNHRVSATNNLAYLSPMLAKQFNVLKNGITPDKIIAGSNTNYIWSCDKNKGHPDWRASSANRFRQGTDCPQCNTWSTSRAETAFRDRALKSKLLTKVSKNHNKKLLIPWRKNKGMSVDIVGYHARTKQPVVIEYDGSYYHADPKNIERDEAKTKALLMAGYLVVRIRENKLLPLPIPSNSELLQLNHKSDPTQRNLENTFQEIEKWLSSK